MVARINHSKNIRKLLHYNEHKLEEGKAVLISANGYLKAMNDLSFNDKLKAFERNISLNQRTSKNTLHISLNFDPSEKLSDDTLSAIAARYMEGIGFGRQPFLVYRHDDAAHPHIHIVTTNIRHNGSRISLHQLAKRKSEPTRLAIEKEFNLVPATRQSIAASQRIFAVDPKVVNYGKSALRRAVANVLTEVLTRYQFTNLTELNALLSLHNIQADTGTPGSRLQQYGGLYYRVIDEEGKFIGQPLKASILPLSPTLQKLEELFIRNSTRRLPNEVKLKATLQDCIARAHQYNQPLQRLLYKARIRMVTSPSVAGRIPELIFIDQRHRCVCTGSALGPEFTPTNMLPLLRPQPGSDTPSLQLPCTTEEGTAQLQLLLATLLQPGNEPDYLPWQWKQHPKNKKKKRSA